ncbi:MAG TPA: MarR family transcriptional regulator [Actinophytocola sp.]|uniref:MarR family winged helix-turn-helix transcriptional regulator n=1 Tax=Actinophytocola sp. TaxID=1872138 RepID=UPI002DDD9069|nr:MarR family transcriptional regulator [Actinophytocola sp.]HEV2781221.1 MarR family transcriptional regulator [Actinophytocola sp.]
MTAHPDPVDALITAWRTELPEVLGPTSELSKRILVLSGELTAATRRVLHDFGWTTAEFDVLATLRRSGRPYCMKPNELSRALLLSSGGTSNVLNQLVRAGLVRREPTPLDRRSTLIVLTDQGIGLTEAAVRAVAEAHAEVFAAVPPAVLRTATRALRQLSSVRRARKKTSTRA